jgi:CubicO group peptidase (beta-lactamase class C family)
MTATKADSSSTATSKEAVAGHVASGFEPVRDAFVANFEQHGEVGGACCVYREGRPVVDLWGGLADRDQGHAWQEDTVAIVFSTTKGVTAICVNRLLEQRVLDLDAPVARYWPEFAAEGKQDIPLRWVLCHKAGLASVEGDLTLEQVLAWDPVVEAIAAQKPNWEPGSAHGYHARSFGWILGEIVRRATGRSLGRFFADEIAGPLGLDFWIGLPERELPRCATLIPPEGGSSAVEEILGADSLTAKVMRGPSGLFGYDEMWNRPDVLAAEMPSSNGVGDARSLARLYAATIGEVDGVRVLAPETVASACVARSEGPDRVILVPTRFGLGFSLPPMLGPACPDTAFGHPGAGGSLAFGDAEHGIGFGYVTNRMRFDPAGDPRAAGLVKSLYACL